jgi:hypothetical protein
VSNCSKLSPVFRFTQQNPVCTSSLLHTSHMPQSLRSSTLRNSVGNDMIKEPDIRYSRYAILHYKFCINNSKNSVKRSSSSPRQDAVHSGWRERRKRTTDSSPKPIWEKNEEQAAASQGLSIETNEATSVGRPAVAIIRRPWRKDFTTDHFHLRLSLSSAIKTEDKDGKKTSIQDKKRWQCVQWHTGCTETMRLTYDQ